jgi:hypothetical protein
MFSNIDSMFNNEVDNLSVKMFVPEQTPPSSKKVQDIRSAPGRASSNNKKKKAHSVWSSIKRRVKVISRKLTNKTNYQIEHTDNYRAPYNVSV